MQRNPAKLHAFLIGIIILVLVLFMLTIGLRLFTRAILVDRMGMKNAFTRLVLDDEAKPMRAEPGVTIVPPEQVSVITQTGLLGSIDNLKSIYTNITRRIIEKTNYFANQQLVFRRPIVEAANSYDKFINWNLAGYSEYNNVIDMGQGYLTNFMNWVNIWDNVAAAAEFKQYLDTRGTPLLFVQIPNKISRKDTKFNNVVDFYNVNADELIGGLQGHGIHTLDLRDIAEEQWADYRSMFYNTDHHWRVEAGLWAAGRIGEELNRGFGFQIDPAVYNPDNYTVKLYPHSFLGSLGKKVTLARAVPDDFALMQPKFDVNLALQIPAIGLDTTGGFDIIYDFSQLEIEDLYERELYGMHLHSAAVQHGFIRMVNKLVKEGGPKVLMLGDSFNYVLTPYLALEFGQLDLVDLRHHKPALRDLIETEGYDMVIIAYSSLFQVEYSSGFSMYDFR